MFEFLTITFPIFALVALGYGSVKKGLFEGRDMKILGAFVMNLALPALLFNAVSQRNLTEVIVPSYMLVYLGAGLTTGMIIYAVASLQGTGPARKAIAMMGAICPNSGYIGYPIMLLLFPDLAANVLAMNMVVENFVFVPLTFALLELSRPRDGQSFLKSAWHTLSGMLRRPLIIALLAGIAVSLLQIPIPVVISRTAGLLANSTAALALVFIGGTLAGLPIVGNRLLASQIVFGKLILFPAAAALLAVLITSFGLPALGDDLRTAVILSAAVPMMGIYAILSAEYGHEGLASIALLGATVGAFFTLNGLLFFLT
jgi:predicted permease